MKEVILFSVFIASALANPVLYYGIQPGVVPYVRVLSAAPIGLDGRVVDTPEVAAAKVQHDVAQVNQRIKLANEEAKSTDPVADSVTNPAAILASAATATVPVPGGAPLGPDGQVVDTPEVTKAKADHAAAQINERAKLTQESIKSSEPVPLILTVPNVLSPPIAISPLIYPIY